MFPIVSAIGELVPESQQAGGEAEQHGYHCTESGLEDLERQLQQGVFRRRIDERSAQRVAYHIDDHTQDDAHQGASFAMISR